MSLVNIDIVIYSLTIYCLGVLFPVFVGAGQPRRHLLTTGWSAFVNKKKLVSGDAVLFLRYLGLNSTKHELLFVTRTNL